MGNFHSIHPTVKLAGVLFLITASIQSLIPRKIWYYDWSFSFDFLRFNVESLGYGISALLLFFYYFNIHQIIKSRHLERLIFSALFWSGCLVFLGFFGGNYPKNIAPDLLTMAALLTFPLALDKDNLNFVDRLMVILGILIFLGCLLDLWSISTNISYRDFTIRKAIFDSELGKRVVPLATMSMYFFGTQKIRSFKTKLLTYFLLSLSVYLVFFWSVRGVMIAFILTIYSFAAHSFATKKAAAISIYILAYSITFILLINDFVVLPVNELIYSNINELVHRPISITTRFEEAFSFLNGMNSYEWFIGRGLGGTFFPLLSTVGLWWGAYGATYVHFHYLTLLLKGGIILFLIGVSLVCYPLLQKPSNDPRVNTASKCVLFFIIVNFADPSTHTLNASIFGIFWGMSIPTFTKIVK